MFNIQRVENLQNWLVVILTFSSVVSVRSVCCTYESSVSSLVFSTSKEPGSDMIC